jgi:hypothetical protein
VEGEDHVTARRRTAVPHYPKNGVAVHGDSRISYHGTRAEAEKARPELDELTQAYGRSWTFLVEKCPYCKLFVVMRQPRTIR